MPKGLIAQASVLINEPMDVVWEALVTPAIIKQYMVGTDVTTDWRVGSKIVWRGEFNGKKYEDHGVILVHVPGERLQYTHYSPLSGLPDVPENYHTVTIDVAQKPTGVEVRLSQDNNKTEKEQEHSSKFWQQMLNTLESIFEK